MVIPKVSKSSLRSSNSGWEGVFWSPEEGHYGIFNNIFLPPTANQQVLLHHRQAFTHYLTTCGETNKFCSEFTILCPFWVLWKIKVDVCRKCKLYFIIVIEWLLFQKQVE